MSAKNAPEKVWLIEGDDALHIHWGDEVIREDEVEYVRADLLPRWVSVKEGLPEPGRYVILYRTLSNSNLRQFTADYNYDIGWGSTLPDTIITHYLSNVPPIPEKT